MDRYEGPETALTIAMNGVLYLAIIMALYEGPITAITIALNGGFYLTIIKER
jgi:hypothetical protein